MTYSFRTNGNFIDFVHTDNTSLQVESVIRSLHNTSRCITWSLPEDTTRISFVIDDIRVDGFPLAEIDFDGTAIDSQDDFETGITAMFTGLAGGDGGSSYLVYSSVMTETGTSNPVPIEFQNTFGSSAWVRDGVGNYSWITALPFDMSKVWVAGNLIDADVIKYQAIYASDGTIEALFSLSFYEETGSVLAINLRVKDASFVAIDISDLTGSLGLPDIRYKQ